MPPDDPPPDARLPAPPTSEGVTGNEPRLPRFGRLYRIAYEEGSGLMVGTVADGRQVIFGDFMSAAFAIFFGPDGGMLECRIANHNPPRTWEEFSAGPSEVMLRWQPELDFRAGPIEVRKFWVDEIGVGIEDYPSHYQDVIDKLARKEPLDELEAEFVKEIPSWNERGRYVLYWGNDWWMNGDGTCEST
jgi:hypothetical protein